MCGQGLVGSLIPHSLPVLPLARPCPTSPAQLTFPRLLIACRCMIKMARQTVSRMDDIKGIRHCDLFSFEPKGVVKPAPVTVVSSVSFQGKTNAVSIVSIVGRAHSAGRSVAGAAVRAANDEEPAREQTSSQRSTLPLSMITLVPAPFFCPCSSPTVQQAEVHVRHPTPGPRVLLSPWPWDVALLLLPCGQPGCT